ncbi:MAG: hypothetical protein GY842_10510 [bacterium]|nr:hypothetical protein [bacterium]
MSDDYRHRPALDSARLAALMWIAPLPGMCWVGLRVLFCRGRWLHKFLVLSVCGNLVFAMGLFLAFTEEDNPQGFYPSQEGTLAGFEFIRCSEGPLWFCRTSEGSELDQALPNTVYVAFAGLIRARFEFVDEKMNALREVTVSDQFGRPWVDVNLTDQNLIYSRYTAEQQTDPEVSLRDKDGDGIPDMMVNWQSQESFERKEELEWHSIKRKQPG